MMNSRTMTQGAPSSLNTQKPQCDAKKMSQDRQHKSAKEEESIERFHKLMHEDEQENIARDGSGFSHRMLPSDLRSGMAPITQTQAPGDKLVERVSALVEKMWVKSSDKTTFPELRLELKSLQLPETELRITKADGLLNIQFITTHAASYQQLAISRSELIQRLKRRLGQDDINVTVNLINKHSGNGQTVNMSDAELISTDSNNLETNEFGINHSQVNDAENAL